MSFAINIGEKLGNTYSKKLIKNINIIKKSMTDATKTASKRAIQAITSLWKKSLQNNLEVVKSDKYVPTKDLYRQKKNKILLTN